VARELVAASSGALLLVMAGAGCGEDVVLYRQPGASDAGTEACPPPDLIGDLVAHWSFDEPPGATRFADVAGGREATCDPCPEAGSAGVIGGAIAFDESGIDIPDALLVEAPGEIHALPNRLSILLWVELHRYGASDYLVSNGPDCPTCGDFVGFALLAHDGTTGPALQLGANAATQVVTGPMLPLDEWHHLAGTFDGTEMQLIIDGAVAATEPTSVGFTNPPSFATRIGSSGEDPVHGVDARIDDLMIFRRSLQASEIQRIVECR
jgi:hypothetical protein